MVAEMLAQSSLLVKYTCYKWSSEKPEQCFTLSPSVLMRNHFPNISHYKQQGPGYHMLIMFRSISSHLLLSSNSTRFKSFCKNQLGKFYVQSFKRRSWTPMQYVSAHLCMSSWKVGSYESLPIWLIDLYHLGKVKVMYNTAGVSRQSWEKGKWPFWT